MRTYISVSDTETVAAVLWEGQTNFLPLQDEMEQFICAKLIKIMYFEISFSYIVPAFASSSKHISAMLS